MTPAKHDLGIHSRCTFSETLTFYTDECMSAPKDWTGYTFDSELRDSVGGTLRETLTVVADSAGQVTISLSAAETGAMTPGATGTWDLLATLSGVTIKLVYGNWTVEGTTTE